MTVINSIAFKQGTINFFQLNNLLCQVEVVAGNKTDCELIPLLFEMSGANMIIDIMKSMRMKDEMSFDLFVMVVAGCIRVCQRRFN
jgi:hypothetical protein